jgi:multidrug efflux pump subunit AcrA (membrane-fusion protein)
VNCLRTILAVAAVAALAGCGTSAPPAAGPPANPPVTAATSPTSTATATATATVTAYQKTECGFVFDS